MLNTLYYRARYYDPNTGEFISRDPLEYVDGMSLYRGYFVLGGVDPMGLSSGWAKILALKVLRKAGKGGGSVENLKGNFKLSKTEKINCPRDVIAAAINGNIVSEFGDAINGLHWDVAALGVPAKWWVQTGYGLLRGLVDDGNLSDKDLKGLISSLASELGEALTPDELKSLAKWMLNQADNLNLVGGTLEQVSVSWDGGAAKVDCSLFVNSRLTKGNSFGWWKYPEEFKVSGSCRLKCTPNSEAKRPCSCPCGESLVVNISGGGTMPSYDSYGNNIVATGKIDKQK